jgi:DNA-3-methyladenine glycosylase II
MTQAATIKARLGNELGEHGAFPAPARLAQLSAPQPGLATRKINQLRTLAAAAQDGALSQQLPGIEPFSAELILIRGAEHPDALPDHDTRLDQAIRFAYNTTDDATIEVITG